MGGGGGLSLRDGIQGVRLERLSKSVSFMLHSQSSWWMYPCLVSSRVLVPVDKGLLPDCSLLLRGLPPDMTMLRPKINIVNRGVHVYT